MIKSQYDYTTKYKKKLNKIITRLRLINKPQGLVIDKNKIHFAQIIGDLFNPELTKNLLVSLSNIILELSPEPSEGAQAVIKNNYLRINTKLLKPDYIG
ncbi:hypothetical protein GF352_00070 [archaeon]|nr:hypothetical protein [archaeon]